jgi:hypothetical protein
METLAKQPLSNLQLELLKVFSHQLNDDEIGDLKKLLVQFFSQRAIDQANKTWDEKGWTDADVDRMLATKLRASKTSDK